MFIVTTDSQPYAVTATYDAAWLTIHRAQGQSVDYATEYGGWAIIEQPGPITGRVYLGRNADRDRVSVEYRLTVHGGSHTTTNHQHLDDPIIRFSMSGDLTEYRHREPHWGGQIREELETITEYAPGWNRDKVASLAQLWKENHLNDVRAGCIHQTPPADPADWDKVRPCPATGYRYGSAWLITPPVVTNRAAGRLLALTSWSAQDLDIVSTA